MRHIFIVNPASGQSRKIKNLKQQIRMAAAETGLEAEIYATRYQGDAERYVRQRCSRHTGEEILRFYACGGDGSLNEVVNGAVGFAGTEVGCIPLGTGNDYVRNYGEPIQFLDLKAQLLGKAVPSDVIRYTEGDRSRYCINMFNIGFDCNVVALTDKVKKLPLIRGSLAYLISVVMVLLQKKGADLKIQYDTGPDHDGKLLLVAIANGCFCGGGVKGIPKAVLNDGLMDVSLIRNNVSRRKFLRLFPKYAKGTHMEEPGVDAVLDYRQCRSITIAPNEGTMQLCIDGEVKTAGTVSFAVVSDKLRFAVPKGIDR